MNQYLIPSNSKRSMLIFGLFEAIDLIILGIGFVISLIIVLIFYTDNSTVTQILGMISPLLFTAVMVLPIPNHRNLWQLTVHIYTYYTNRKTYIWRGWCVTNGENDE